MIMTHPDGTAWAQVYGGGTGDRFRAVAIAPDGGVVVGGEGWSTEGDFPSDSGGIALAAKIHPDGTLAWSHRFGANMNLGALTAVAIGADGRIAVGGYVDSRDVNPGCGGGNYCGMVAELTADGDPLWQKTFAGDKSILGIAVTPDGYVVATGTNQGACPKTTDYHCSFVMMSDPSGNVLWTTMLDENNWETLNGVAVAPDGGVIAVGSTDSSERGVAVKLTRDGAVEWSNMVPSDQYPSFDAVAVNPDGGIVAVGYSSGVTSIPGAPNSRSGLVTLISPAGQTTWSKTFGTTGDTEFTCVATASDQIVVAGTTTSTVGAFANTHGAAHDDAVLLRLNPDGQLS